MLWVETNSVWREWKWAPGPRCRAGAWIAATNGCYCPIPNRAVNGY
jgi:hypothetical protein